VPKQVYLVTFLDDATRLVLHGEFYPVLDQLIVEDCFRKSILKHGIPQSVFFDNGTQYRTKWMQRACSKMGIKLLYAKPYSPEATGKVERFNRLIDSFLAETALEKPKTLDQLNGLFQVWLEECYQQKSHSALEGKSPRMAYNSDPQEIRFLDAEVVADAFLHCEERRVDKAGCISFSNLRYEVGLNFIGCTVSVIYDPADITDLTIEYEGYAPWKAKKLVIGERAGQRPKLPESMIPVPAASSRLLAAAAEVNRTRQEQTAPAVSFRNMRKEAEENV
jgi:hypothetical protein